MLSRTTSTLFAMCASALFSLPQAEAQELSHLKGDIRINGSSTVYPITEAVAEEFAEAAPDVRVTVGISGTGGGFKRFAVGETDISDASRPIKKKELENAVENGVDFIEIPVAYDGLSIVVNTENYWVDQLTIDELKRIFLDGTTVTTWKDVRPEWPDLELKIYAPGTDSGTFDYFKEVVAGKTGAIRSDMSVSEDDNVLVRGVAGDRGGIGFFGCAYYFENKDKLRVVPVVNPETDEAVTPTPKTIESGSYAPFSRPLLIYVNARSARKPHVRAFVGFYLEHGPALAEEVGYVKLPQEMYARAIKNVRSRRTGTQFLDAKGEKITGPLTKVYH
ncbi:MAG: PstS family phosphate ABC transporter substrate-binding protein [Dehalococcoidia bacterium]